MLVLSVMVYLKPDRAEALYVLCCGMAEVLRALRSKK
jgi:hypothetical protein